MFARQITKCPFFFNGLKKGEKKALLIVGHGGRAIGTLLLVQSGDATVSLIWKRELIIDIIKAL